MSSSFPSQCPREELSLFPTHGPLFRKLSRTRSHTSHTLLKGEEPFSPIPTLRVSVSPLPSAGCCALYPLKTYGLPGTLPHLGLCGDLSPSPWTWGDASYLLQGCGAHGLPLAPLSPSGAAPTSGSASQAWRRSHARQLTDSAQSEVGVGDGPGQLPVYRPGLQKEDEVVSK